MKFRKIDFWSLYLRFLLWFDDSGSRSDSFFGCSTTVSSGTKSLSSETLPVDRSSSSVCMVIDGDTFGELVINASGCLSTSKFVILNKISLFNFFSISGPRLAVGRLVKLNWFWSFSLVTLNSSNSLISEFVDHRPSFGCLSSIKSNSTLDWCVCGM